MLVDTIASWAMFSIQNILDLFSHLSFTRPTEQLGLKDTDWPLMNKLTPPPLVGLFIVFLPLFPGKIVSQSGSCQLYFNKQWPRQALCRNENKTQASPHSYKLQDDSYKKGEGRKQWLGLFSTSEIDSLSNKAQPFMLRNNSNVLSWHSKSWYIDI